LTGAEVAEELLDHAGVPIPRVLVDVVDEPADVPGALVEKVSELDPEGPG